MTSSSNTWSLDSSTSSPVRRRSLVPTRSVRAVATTGRLVVFRRRRVSSKPMPREAGVVRIQGRAIPMGRVGWLWRKEEMRGSSSAD